MYLTGHTASLVKSTSLAILVTALSFAFPIFAAPRNGIETAPGPDSEFGRLCVQTQASGWSVQGQLRLLDNPLRHSNPGRVVLQAIAPNGQTLAAADMTIYRVITANPRARLFGFRGGLSDGFPAAAVLRVQHLPAGP
ncbi:MAG TPA: hypothetical protein VFL97_00515 [Nitrococcus sp.]|nr:hypothetical protein [Nitrococcus sp.]